jgi:hypothetical protein
MPGRVRLVYRRLSLPGQRMAGLARTGFGKDHALEVIAIVAASTITNYTGSITKTPLEAPFQAHAWGG